MPIVFIPPPLRTLTGGADRVEATGTSVRRVIDDLERQYPGIRDRLCDGNELRSGLAVAVDGTISSLGLMQKVQDTSEVHFLPALGGG
jgi:molybdopterin synthase sulfur carrier subunit